jgi:hypothetical protein
MYERQVMCRAYKLSWVFWVREGLLEDDACTASSLVAAVWFVAVLVSPEQKLIWEWAQGMWRLGPAIVFVELHAR